MPSLRAISTLRWSLSVVGCALLLVALVGSTSAFAGSCGDYLHLAGDHSAVEMDASDRDVADRLTAPGVPCHGPKCKKAPQRENASPPPAPTISPPRYDAVVNANVEATRARQGFARIEEMTEAPAKLVRSRLDRPPRAC